MTIDHAIGWGRRPLEGTWQVLRFNWPRYATAILVASAATLMLVYTPVPQPWRAIVIIGAGLAIFWSAGSLVASYWTYDHSGLTDWDWIRDHLRADADRVEQIVNIHAGFDNTTSRLGKLFPQSAIITIDLFDPDRMTERSIHRARHVMPPQASSIAGRPECVPLPDASADVVLLLFAAHEIRQPASRQRLFGELRRLLKARGQVIVVEHVRDPWNFLAFGPGCWHFFPRGEWLRVAARSGLRLVADGRKTPFVRYFVWEI